MRLSLHQSGLKWYWYSKILSKVYEGFEREQASGFMKGSASKHDKPSIIVITEYYVKGDWEAFAAKYQKAADAFRKDGDVRTLYL